VRPLRIVLAALVVLLTTATPAVADPTGGSGGPLTDRTFLTFTGAGYTAQYHLYSAGIDRSRPVGLLVYADGTGEYGFENPSATYSLGGINGVVAVAKRHNMVLLTPSSPNRACQCWEQGDPTGYSDYLAALIESVYGQYDIDRDRVWLGGYSTGAQLTTRFMFPRHSELMTGGGTIVIGGGGAPAVTADDFPASLKADMHMHWDTGELDTDTNGSAAGGLNSLNGPYGAKAGEAWYADRGFRTSHDYPAGVGHARNGQFGTIIERVLDRHAVQADGSEPPASPQPWDHTVTPTRVGVTVSVYVPPNTARTTLRVSAAPFGSQAGFSTYRTTSNDVLQLSINSSLTPNRSYHYQLETGTNRTVVASGTFRTLP
jgi:poly(3-hydroxybutyrate) depolymerase